MTGKTNAGSGAQVFYLGAGTSFDVSNVPGYQNLTEDNFILGATCINTCRPGSEDRLSYISLNGYNPTISYDKNTGIVTVNNNVGTWYVNGDANGHYYENSGNITMNMKVYLVKGKIK